MPRCVLILNGKKYVDGTFREGITLAEFVFPPLGGSTTNELLGFTNRDSFLEWSRNEGLQEQAHKMVAGEDLAKEKIAGLTEAERTSLAQEDLTKAQEETKRKLKLIEDRGVKLTEVDKLKELAREGVIGSSIIYDWTWFGNFLLYILGGPYGLAYANFNWWGCNDKAESGLGLGGSTVLYQHSWFRGRRYIIWGYQPHPDFGDFKNRASSALGYV